MMNIIGLAFLTTAQCPVCLFGPGLTGNKPPPQSKPIWILTWRNRPTRECLTLNKESHTQSNVSLSRRNIMEKSGNTNHARLPDLLDHQNINTFVNCKLFKNEIIKMRHLFEESPRSLTCTHDAQNLFAVLDPISHLSIFPSHFIGKILFWTLKGP